LWVRYDGNVSFGHSGQCIKEGKFYGNVADDSLGDIKRKIQNDSTYQAFKLGGARFMYHLAQKINPDFKIIGRTRCDVCNAFFRDIKLVSAVREMLNKEGVAESYKEFVNKLNFRKKAFL